MFRITANYDNRHHPLHGDIRTVSSVAEALAAMPDVYPPDVDDDDVASMLRDLAYSGGLEYFYGDQVEYTVERIAL